MPTRQRFHVLVTTAHVLAVLGALLTAGAIYFIGIHLHIAGAVSTRVDYAETALTMAIVATLLLALGPVCIAGLGGSRWVLATYVGLGVLLLVAGALTWTTRPDGLARDGSINPLYAVQYAFLIPTSYPLLLLALVAGGRLLLRGRSSRGPR